MRPASQPVGTSGPKRAAARVELDPQAMLVFGALARTGGVRRAAASLGLPRSTVSRRLAQLEAGAGAALVVRTARRFALTELGAALAERCEQLEALLREADELVLRASAEPSGMLRVAAPPVLGEEVLPEILAELVRRHPRLGADVRLSADYVDLRRGSVDLALRAGPLDDATDLFATRLGTSVSGCYASPAYIAAHGVPAVPADLARHECIIVGSAAAKTWEFQTGSRSKHVPVSGRVRVDNFRVARGLAVRGAGVTHIACIFATHLVQTGELVPLLERFWPEVQIHAVHAGANPPPPKVRAFVEIARAVVAKLFSGQKGAARSKAASREQE